jgi:hypothetical protein
MTLGDVMRRFRERSGWAAIPQGHRVILRETGGRVPVVLNGLTLAELAEPIRTAGSL